MRVLIVTGLSGGHIYPALALADFLKDSKQNVLLVLPDDGRKSRISVNFAQIEYIHAARLSFGLNKNNLLNVYLFLLGSWQVLRIIIKFKPLVVVGFGSLNSISLIFWAWLFRIKTIIHEQNVVCGKANRLLSKFVDRVAVSFNQTRNYLNISDEKIVLTGNPLRLDLVEVERKVALDFFKFKEGRFNILITGGSQGAHKLNTICLGALSTFQNKIDLQVMHICGTQDFNELSKGYLSTTLNYQLFDFFKQMQYAYSIADLIICRAGATTIAELAKFKVPAILVPYPFAYAHQLTNAQVLSNIGAAEILLDEDLTIDKIKERLKSYFADREKLKAMRMGYQKLPVLRATEKLASEVLSLNQCLN